MKHSMLITIDVEDWFQVENFKKAVSYAAWDNYSLRVEQNTYRLLDLLGDRTSTFFCLGWVAKRLPDMIREIHHRGHEVASHGCKHDLCNQMSYNDLKQDLTDSKSLLEDIIGAPVVGYRAPSFSINRDILKIIEDCGYRYDSSYNSFAMHGRYGHLDLSGYEKQGIAVKISDNFYELPVSNLNIGKRIIPWAGGGYFRLIPFPVFKWGVRAILNQNKAYLFYMHPWEIDPDQPRSEELPLFYKFRHYTNLEKSHLKLSAMLDGFNQARFLSCSDYIASSFSRNFL
jgi:polysaccharide deacetylase family protein (PEP-CTERM system associated)